MGKNTSLGLDKSLDISLNEERQVIVSQGLSEVHIHPNTGLSNTSLLFTPVVEAIELRVFYTLGSEGFEAITSNDRFEILSTGDESLVTTTRVFRDVTIQTTENNILDFQIIGSLTISFTNYMESAIIEIRQDRPARLDTFTATGGGLTADATAALTDDTNRANIAGEDTVQTMTVTVTGEQDATYLLTTTNGALFSGAAFSVTPYTIPLSGTVTHTVSVSAQMLNEEVQGDILITHTVTSQTLTIQFDQVGDNQPTLNIVTTSSTSPVRGIAVTFNFSVTNADPGLGQLQRSNDNFVSNNVGLDATVGSDGTVSGTSSVTPFSPGERQYRFFDISGRVSPIFVLTVNPATPILSGAGETIDWNDQETTTVFSITGLTLAQRQSINESDFSVIQSSPESPTYGNIGAVAYSTSAGTITYTTLAIDPNTSVDVTLTYSQRLSLATPGANDYTDTASFIKSVRPPNPVTFPNHVPTEALDATATSITFLTRHDSSRNTLALTDVTGADMIVGEGDIWSDSRLANAAVVNVGDPGQSSNPNDIDSYLNDRNVTLTQGQANTSLLAVRDQIVVSATTT